MPNLQTAIRLHVRPVDSALAREILQEAAIHSVVKPNQYTGADRRVITFLAIAIGLLLAVLLVQALAL
jgi:hypothetical protein